VGPDLDGIGGAVIHQLLLLCNHGDGGGHHHGGRSSSGSYGDRDGHRRLQGLGAQRGTNRFLGPFRGDTKLGAQFLQVLLGDRTVLGKHGAVCERVQLSFEKQALCGKACLLCLCGWCRWCLYRWCLYRWCLYRRSRWSLVVVADVVFYLGAEDAVLVALEVFDPEEVEDVLHVRLLVAPRVGTLSNLKRMRAYLVGTVADFLHFILFLLLFFLTTKKKGFHTTFKKFFKKAYK
jgi:hypothetical protein